MTTPTQPADLLAPLLALAERVRNMSNIEFVDQAREREEIVAELESLAAHRGEAEPVGWTTPTSLEMLRDPQCGVGMMHSRRTDYINVPLFQHPPQAQAGAGDAAEMDAFHDGVILALQVLNAGGDTGNARYVELVNCYGLDLLVKRAKTEGMMELSGLDVYLRDSRVVADRKRNKP